MDDLFVTIDKNLKVSIHWLSINKKMIDGEKWYMISSDAWNDNNKIQKGILQTKNSILLLFSFSVSIY